MVRFIAGLGMNTYIYAPKEDPFHRKNWSEPYPETEKNQLIETIKVCAESGVDFNFALSPGLSISYSNRNDRNRLLDKYSAAAEWGATSFSLFLDDIPRSLADGGDKKMFKSLASAQADLANGLFERLEQRLLFCPTEYAGTRTTPYLETLGRELDEGIPILWTGPRVVSHTITRKDARAFAAAVGRKPYLWDNYPVNDFAPNRIFLGPFRGREAGLACELCGYVSNPMNQPFASGIALRTLADYFEDPEGYDPEKAWTKAVRSAAPDGLGAEFALAAGMLKPSRLEKEQKTPLSRKEGEKAAGYSRKLLSALDRLLHEASRHPLLTEISGWLRDMVLRCRVVLAAEKTAAAAWPDRELVGRRHTLSSADEICRAEKILLPLMRKEELLFETLLKETREEGLACVLLDAGEAVSVSKITALWGRPFEGEPPSELPLLETSRDGCDFERVPLEKESSSFTARLSGRPLRFVRITGPGGHHLYLIFEAVKQRGKEQ